MKKLISKFTGLLVAATAFGVASPANANGTWTPGGDVLVGGFSWAFVPDGNYLVGDGGPDLDEDGVWDGYEGDSTEYSDVWDSIGYFQFYVEGNGWNTVYCEVNGGSGPELNEASDGSGDLVLTCDTNEIAQGVTATVSARFYAEGDMVRMEATLSNDSGSEINYDWYGYGEYGSHSEIDFEIGRGWEIERYGSDMGDIYTNEAKKLASIAWGLSGSDYFPEYIVQGDDYYEVQGTNDDEENSSVPLAAGTSIKVVMFAAHNMLNNGMNTDEAFTAWVENEFSSFSGRLTRGLEGVNVVNWGEVQTQSTTSPTIANGYRADALGSVYFAPGSSKLSKAAQDQLKALVTANPTAIYKVTGYVQKSGTSVNDAKLSLARAKSVESYLASLGAGVTFNVVVDTGLVPAKEGTSAKARKATLFAMTPVVQ